MARPARCFVTGPLTRALLVITWGLVVAGVGVVALRYRHLPATIPTHFGLLGRPDGFGPRSSILILVVIWLFIQALLSVLSRHPRMFNYPVPLTEENAQRLYREGERLMIWLGLAVAVAFLGLVWSVAVAWTTGRVLIAVGLVATFASLGAGIVLLLRAGVDRSQVSPGRPGR